MIRPPRNRNDDHRHCGATCRGITLIEILFVVAILGLVAAGAVTYFQPSLADELENAAQVVFGDVERARNLAVANNSRYKLTFHEDCSGYYLQHSGSNGSLNTLPSWPYRLATDSSDRQTTLLGKLPGLSNVELIGVVKVTASGRTKVSNVEFTTAGATSIAEPTEIWLAAGKNESRRYLTVTINPITGLAETGEIAAAAPTVHVAGGSTVSLDLLGTSVTVGADESGINVGVGVGGTTIIDLGLGS